MSNKVFKIMHSDTFVRKWLDEHEFPKYLPFDVMELFRDEVMKNHGQTLERLNERGGLSPGEIYIAANKLGLKGFKKEYEIRGLVYILDIIESYADAIAEGIKEASVIARKNNVQ